MNYSYIKIAIGDIFGKTKLLILPLASNNYRSRFLQSNFLLYCVVLLFVVRVTTTLVSINFPQNIFFADITKTALENFVNQTRRSVGLAPLTENNRLNQAAQLKAENMVQNEYFDHTSPSGISPWFWFKEAGYSYKYAGENLAVGFFESSEVYNAWLNSPSHRANIVNPNYTEVGTAVLAGFGPGDAIVVVQEFGKPLPAKTVSTNANATPAPVVTTVEPENTPTAPEINSNNEKVLSQTTEIQSSLGLPDGIGTDSRTSKFINFVLYNYDILLQNIIYGFSLIVIGILLVLVSFNFECKFKKELVFRAVVIILLLSVANFAKKEIIISLIPHQIMI